MNSAILITIYSLLVVAVAIAGAVLPRLIRLTHTRLQVLMSLVAGFMLGVSLLHMIPHAYAEIGSLDRTMLLVLVGLLGMFFLMRLFHVHTHEFEETGEVEAVHEHGEHCDHDHADDHAHDQAHEKHEHEHVHGPECDHGHDHDHGHGHHHDHDHVDQLLAGGSMAWMGLFAGLAVHTITDGMFLAASVAAEAEHEASWMPAGLGTFLAVFLHKPLDTLSIAILMRGAGWSNRAALIAATIFGMMCPLGSAILMFGLQGAGDSGAQITGMALALGGGFFLCISLADLLPELSFHSHDRAKLSVALLAGIVISYLVGLLEPHGAHDHKHGADSQENHSHEGHSH